MHNKRETPAHSGVTIVGDIEKFLGKNNLWARAAVPNSDIF